eukprot:TRINITY_DN313_c0_g1_i3.p1 TRINITY_DN313_c0_g1~~TRINITY_DN313_c0_g1_i3.p1  ORF type:complete len:276 (-),score=46.87 TRINITY_DN313_c0_g1_i3:168-995(-)
MDTAYPHAFPIFSYPLTSSSLPSLNCSSHPLPLSYLKVLSNMLMITPLFVNVFGLAGVTLIITFHSTSSYSTKMKKKKEKMVRLLWLSNICWYVYLFAYIYFGFMNLTGTAIHSTTIIRFVYRLADIGIALSIASMIDQKTSILLLTKWFFGGADIGESSSQSTVPSSSRPSSDTPTKSTDNTTSALSMNSVSIAITSPFSPKDGSNSLSELSDPSEQTSSNGGDTMRAKLNSARGSKKNSKKNSKKSSKKSSNNGSKKGSRKNKDVIIESSSEN